MFKGRCNLKRNRRKSGQAGKPALYMLLLLLALLAPPTKAETLNSAFKNQTLTQLEKRLEKIDAELELLAHYSLRTGIGSIGYRSAVHDSADQMEWLQIELKQETPIDRICWCLPSGVTRKTDSAQMASLRNSACWPAAAKPPI